MNEAEIEHFGPRTLPVTRSSAAWTTGSVVTTRPSSTRTTSGAIELEHHIPACLDDMDVDGRRVLEIGLGQGAEAEQLIRRGARWSGLDLTGESVGRVRRRLEVRHLPSEDVREGSALDIPWPDNSFDIVFSHGVLHHIPDILGAQAEIHRVLKPGGKLVVMLYARRSLNYLVSIAAPAAPGHPRRLPVRPPRSDPPEGHAGAAPPPGPPGRAA